MELESEDEVMSDEEHLDVFKEFVDMLGTGDCENNYNCNSCKDLGDCMEKVRNCLYILSSEIYKMLHNEKYQKKGDLTKFLEIVGNESKNDKPKEHGLYC